MSQQKKGEIFQQQQEKHIFLYLEDLSKDKGDLLGNGTVQ